MTLTSADFFLSSEQLDRINQHFQDQAARHAEAGEDPPDSVHVTFLWVPGYGRMVTAYFDGAVQGCSIDGPFLEGV